MSRAWRWWPLLVVLAALVATTTAVVTGWSATASVDRVVGRAAFGAASARPWLARGALVVQAAFGTAGTTLATVLVAALLVLAHRRRTAMLVLVAMTSTAVLTAVVKVVVDRPRPVWAHPLVVLHSPGFPSGHSSGTAAAATLAVLLAARGRRRTVTVVAVIVAGAVGADRLLLGVHRLSDVVGGYLLGVAVVLALVRLTSVASGRPAVASRPSPSATSA